MTFEGISVAQPAEAEAMSEAFDGRAFMVSNGLETIADEVFEAHGISMPLWQVLESCKPAAALIENLNSSLKDLPDRTTIIKGALVAAAVSTTERDLPDDDKKKLN